MLATATGCDDESAPQHEDEDFDIDEWVDEEFPSQPDDLGSGSGSTVQLPGDAGSVMPPNVASAHSPARSEERS
jgi:hypothetical protein